MKAPATLKFKIWTAIAGVASILTGIFLGGMVGGAIIVLGVLMLISPYV